MKKYLAMILALVMALSLVACGDNQDEAAGRVFWLNFKPEADGTLQKVAAMYTEKTGVPVTVVTAASGTYNETLTAEMDKSAPPTLFVVGNQAAVETWGDYCYNLSGTDIANQLNTDAYNLYDADGKLCSIGYCYECYGIIVNEDLLEKAGYTLGDITNFETLKAVAEDIHARASELGFDAFTSSSMSDDSSWRFTGHLANLEYYYESVDDPDAWKACPPTITGAYMQNYKNLWDLYINNSAVNPADLAAGGFDAADEFGKRFAEKHCEDAMHYFVGAGNQYGSTYSYAMCYWEEQHWLRSKSIHAAEFFHGTLEIVDKNTPVTLFMGEDSQRPLAERVKNFLPRVCGNYTIIDSAEYPLVGISPEFRGDISHLVTHAVTQRIDAHMEQINRHPMEIRRYYRQFPY